MTREKQMNTATEPTTEAKLRWRVLPRACGDRPKQRVPTNITTDVERTKSTRAGTIEIAPGGGGHPVSPGRKPEAGQSPARRMHGLIEKAEETWRCTGGHTSPKYTRIVTSLSPVCT